MKNSFLLFILIGISAAWQSCSEFISLDISDKTVTVLSPSDNDTLSSYSVLFWWEEIEGAEEYHLQVVKPSFNNIQELELDTVIDNNKFYFSLEPGTYQWKVRALNNAGHTPYTLSTVTIDSTLDLTSQTVQLISPVNNTTVNNLTQTFKWYNMPLADNYTFQVSTGNSVIYSNTVSSDSISYTFPNFGIYKWKVWAGNANSSSHFSQYTITVQAPVSAPYAPSYGDTVSTSLVSMSWIRPSTSSITADSLIIAEDPLFTTIVHSQLHTGTSYTFPGVMNRQYYWKLRSRSSNGTFSSNYSPTYSFYIGL